MVFQDLGPKILLTPPPRMENATLDLVSASHLGIISTIFVKSFSKNQNFSLSQMIQN
jgi:hypothetical protein